MSGHTKGPWDRNIKPATKYNTVWSGRNKNVAYLATSEIPEHEVEANICLIAAAPDLLAALDDLVKEWGDDDLDDPFWNAARAAVAKARGETK